MIQDQPINEKIRFAQVRVIDSDGQQLGLMSSLEALQKAREQELDLVLVAPEARPPVCRIADYGHMKYEAIKKEKDSKKASRNKSGLVKELKMSLKIGEHDYQVRKKAAENFLVKGYKVKISIQFRGREITHPEVGQSLMHRFCMDLTEYADVEEGRIQPNSNYLISMLSPKKNYKPRVKVEEEGAVYSTEKGTVQNPENK